MDPAANPTSTLNPPAFPATDATPPVFQTIETADPVTPPSSTPTAPPSDSTSNVVEASPKGKGNRKRILAALAILLMIVGIGAGVFLVRNQEISRSSAWDCSLYSFTVSENGTVTVANGSSRDEPQQQAQVYVNNNLVDTFNVPALESGEGATLGTISLPTDQSYSWRIEGTKDCRDSGQSEVSEPSVSCSAVVAYDEDWSQLSAAQLSALSKSDIVRFAVSGTATSGTFDRARFSINGGPSTEVTDKRPGSEEFYYEYEIPTGTTNFAVSAEIFHNSVGWF
ncbi:hypothetical protein A2803_05370 [Candidatus Woesebacteria bacterium RIFCSPHIGHO2_01_FULL_44_21]|uniref:Uncharacterized protein n=1 Tax=Candidatus Woesebacteria bacterium RIFCSPHIGHO2_01_FULL_44_21 TaxID=1802503 RepID=A0A1F7YUS0_9BACT|nr:MAG: hypothetical protein A2803_05370 [Candidatus Woesebacteria bacterium RIFCSPHIGHO2_01_FULL_44_21]OGM68796.1 MAG: hypothetical protein A2897_01345 [Candidatus Woesebacteria bacterium RIFCSPLOWO2_01_FULL_44_24b]